MQVFLKKNYVKSLLYVISLLYIAPKIINGIMIKILIKKYDKDFN